MRPLHATIAAFVLAPLVPAAWFALNSGSLGGGLSAGPRVFAGFALLGYMYSAWFVALLALPLFLVLRKRGQVGLVGAVCGGAFVGAVVAALLQFQVGLGAVAGAIPPLAGVGAAAGLVFWAVRSLLLCVGSSGNRAP